MSFKRPRDEEAEDVTLFYLLQDLRGIIPDLSLGNLSLQSSAHTQDTGHEDALINFLSDMQQREAVDIPDLLSGSNIYTNYRRAQPSHLLLNLQGRQSLVYQNETEIQFYVMDIFKDAIKLLGLETVLSVRPEISLFSYRPDIIVVTHLLFGIVLVVEVKKPGFDVFTSKSVSGQVYDYLVGMLARGVSQPFAVLSSYNQMVIAHLDDDGKSTELLKEVANTIKNDMMEEIAFMKEGDGQPNINAPQAPGSPLSNLNAVVSNPVRCVGSDDRVHHLKKDDNKNSDGNDDANDDDSDNSDDGDWKRTLCYSNVVGRVDMLKSVILAIRCGIRSCMQSSRLPLPLQGTSPSHSCACVNQNGMVWCDLPSSVVIDYHSSPSARTDRFYLLRDLGKGRSGRAFLACNSGGKALVAKFFLLKNNDAHRPHESDQVRQQQRTLLLEKRKSEATMELDYWMTVYGGKYAVQMTKLHRHWCLLLPYFDPLTSVEARKAALPKVRSILEHFKTLKLQYKTSDVRWRHVGIREDQICLFDLGSLEECKNALVDVDAQMQILEESVEELKT